jgi:hypothetical protein
LVSGPVRVGRGEREENTMTISITLLVLMLVGLLIYAFAQGKLSEVGRIMFFCALLALCFGGGGGTFALKIR